MNNSLLYGFRALIFAALISVSSCTGINSDKHLGTQDGLAVTYVCPMKCKDSESHKPGKCPVCNMLLVKSIELDSSMTNMTHSHLSIYNSDEVWLNQNNKKVALNEFTGQYHLVSMIFTHCEYACPNLIGDMLNIDDDMEENKKDQVNFLLISIDPNRDTPERLKAFAADMDLNLNRWSLLNGETKLVDDIASKLGISYKKFENGAFGHSNIISLLNPQGEILYQLEGIHSDRKELVNFINQL